MARHSKRTEEYLNGEFKQGDKSHISNEGYENREFYLNAWLSYRYPSRFMPVITYCNKFKSIKDLYK